MPCGLPQVVILIGLFAGSAAAAPALVEEFDGPSVVWTQVPNRFGVKLTQHERVRQDTSGQQSGAEYFRLQGPPGYSAVLLMPIKKAPVIDDLSIQYRVKSSHPGVTPAIRVVFPRVTDPGTGQPLVAVVRGNSRSEGTSQWEQLLVSDTTTLVRRHARALGGMIGRSVDEREAFVDAVVLVAPANPMGSQLWIDRLQIEGLLTGDAPSEATEGARSQSPRPLRRVTLSQHGFAIEDQMFYPRIISHNGEPLSDLKQLGFNTIAFEAAPSPDLMKEAARLKLQVVCPCGPHTDLQSELQAELWEPVIAWLLPQRTDEKAIDAGAAWVEQIRRTDLHLQRPVLARPSDGWLPWSRLSDGLVVQPRLISAPAMLKEVERQLGEASRFAQPGTPLLATIPATHSERFMQQAAAFAPSGTVTPWRTPAEVSREVELAATLGACGVWVTSTTPLSDNRSQPQRARVGLSRLNVKLALLEPWLRDGVPAGQATTVGAEQTAAIFSRSRTLLLAPRVHEQSGNQPGPLKYIASGISESARAYELSPVSLRPTEVVRLAGGARIDAERADSLLLITEDTRAAAEVSRRIATMAGRAASLEQAMAIAELQHAEAHLSPLALTAGSRSPDAAVLGNARREISLSKTAQSTRDLPGAYQHALEANRILADWGNERIAAALRSNSLESSPLANQPATIIDQQRLLSLIQPLRRGPNLLAGGNFETHQGAADSGWRHVSRDSSGGATEVAFSDQEAAIGQRSLLIRCGEENEDVATDAVVAISSPAVRLRPGELVEITGLVRVQQVTEGGSLTISDSLGAEELALTVDQPTAWRMFRLLRRCLVEGPVDLKFTARGPITAGVDGVMIRSIELPSAVKAAVFGAPALQRK